jgi:hypothetical protein
VTRTTISSVQYVDRTDRILVISERTAPPNPARLVPAGVVLSRVIPAVCAVAVMSGHPSRVNASAAVIADRTGTCWR